MVAAAVAAGLTACASVQPVAYSGIASSSYLKADPRDKSGRSPYSYSTQADWRQYRQMMIEPVVVYRGSDNQFGNTSAEDREALAQYMQATFAKKLQTRFQIVDRPGPGTLRLKLTLTGAAKTTPVVGTLLHLDIAGNVYNGVQAMRGREGAMTGAVFYSVEIYDASTNKLLNAYVAKQYPNAMNIGASFGGLSASKTGIDKGADALLAQLQ
ncbi:DUF3313 domain-containing protein [Trinickia caryophylli]|nr:DUF3313 domain-containing protein [Trinickia caryophylli]PMS13832.1 DUF3313 domain-containing protein [Trinickia caryophylli]TRX15385.1 DUF3313 domain-containing protein [Trinickia caryophylli]WQE15725.1 DUF3313 domain-containing protein [Trinickia caryophylli]